MPLKKNWVLTQEAFDELLSRLDRDRQRAAERYENLRQMLITFFEFRGSLIPEEDTDETLNRLSRRISEGQEITCSIETYVYSIARNVSREHLAQPQRLVSVDELPDHLSPKQDSNERIMRAEEDELFERQVRCLESCLQTLTLEQRELITRYYQGEGKTKIQNRKRLADELEIPLNALRIRASRLRDRLEACVKICLTQSSVKRN